MRRMVTAALFTFWLLTVAAAQPLLDKPQLVTTEWLAQHLNDPRLRVVDARDSLRDYLQGHIPNAIYLNTETLRVSQGGVPARLLPPERLAEIFGAIGIGNNHTVVIYSSSRDAFAHATYVAFVLEILGHRSIGVLDGGFEKWQSEGRPVSREFPKVAPIKFVPKIQSQLMADWFTVWRVIQKGEAQILDARDSKTFAAGHNPSAHNAFLRENLQGEGVLTWLDGKALMSRFKSLGIDLNKPIVTYCTSGRQASQLYFTLRHVLGLPQVTLYHGSWIDWTARKLPKE